MLRLSLPAARAVFKPRWPKCAALGTSDAKYCQRVRPIYGRIQADRPLPGWGGLWPNNQRIIGGCIRPQHGDTMRHQLDPH